MGTEDNSNKSKYKIGMRTFKTALAVFFCLLLYPFMGISGVILAAISAIICMRETYSGTLKVGFISIIGTLIGGIIAYIYLLIDSKIKTSPSLTEIPFSLDWLPYVMIPIFIIICIYICNIFNIKEASTMCTISFLIVVLGAGDDSQKDIIINVILRVVATLLGIVITMLINRFIAPYDINQVTITGNNTNTNMNNNVNTNTNTIVNGNINVSTNEIKSKYKIGMRTYKTALAVFFCLLLYNFIGTSGVSSTAITAIICMKETQSDTIKTGVVRMIGTIIGGILAYIYLLIQYNIKISSTLSELPFSLDWLPYILIPVFIIICIYLCNIFKVKEASTICSIAFIVVILGFGDASHIELIGRVALRVVATLLGIVIAMLINRFIAPYDKNEANRARH